MAISFVGASAGASTTAVVPAHAAGDVIYAFAWREASLTNPTIPAGYTAISNTVDGVAQSISFGYRVATGTSDGTNTWTNAAQMAVGVYRGLNVSGVLFGAWIASAENASATTAVYAALTLSAAQNSWLVGFGAHRSTNTSINTAPTGMTARASLTGGGEVGIHDTNGVVTSWGAQGVALGGTANNWMTIVLELYGGTSFGISHVSDIQAKPAADSTYAKSGEDSTDFTYAGTIQAEPTVGSVLNLHKILDLGYVQGTIAADSTYAKGVSSATYTYSGAIEADVVADSDRYKTKDYVASVGADVEIDSVYAKGGTGTAYPYVGTIEALVALDSIRFKSKDYTASVGADVEIDSARRKAKNYYGTGESQVAIDSVRFKTKDYAGLVAADVEAASTLSKAKVYVASVEAEVSTDYSRRLGRVRDGSVEAEVAAQGSYLSTASRTYTYLGTAELVVEGSSKVAVGKAYRADGRLVVELGGAYALTTSAPVAHVYSGTLLLSLAAQSLYSGPIAVSVRITEPLPVTTWVLEGSPSDGYTLEPVPTRPAAQDGVYTEPVQDGFWDEYPKDGAYAPVGYFKEFKPFHRATMTKEADPTTSSTKEGKPS